jgi:tRNA uridine 5-carboxymethylaminomethyl modification enzyme
LGKPLEREYRLLDLLRRPDVTYQSLLTLPGAAVGATVGATDPQVIEQTEIQAKYQGYIERQREEIERTQSNETLPLQPDLNYCEVRGLSIEVQQKLNQHRPETLGQASRMQGVTPAAISLLLVHLKRREKKRA